MGTLNNNDLFSELIYLPVLLITDLLEFFYNTLFLNIVLCENLYGHYVSMWSIKGFIFLFLQVFIMFVYLSVLNVMFFNTYLSVNNYINNNICKYSFSVEINPWLIMLTNKLLDSSFFISSYNFYTTKWNSLSNNKLYYSSININN